MSAVKPKFNTRLLIGIALADFLAAIDSTAVTLAIPRMARELHLSEISVSLFQIVYILALVIALIPAGKIGDIYGHKKSFQFGLWIFGIASLSLIFSLPFPLLLACRTLQGAAAGILYTAGGALIARNWEDTEIPFGVSASFFSFGMIVGPVIGGILTDATIGSFSGWHAIFAINVPLCLLGLGLLHKAVKNDSPETNPEKIDWTGFMLLSLFLVGLVITILEPSHRLAYALITLVLGTGLVVTERNKPNAMVQLKLFKIQTFSAIAIFTLVFMFVLNAFSFTNTFYLQQVLGHSATQSGLLLLPLSLGMGVFSVLSGFVRNWRLSCIVASILLIIGTFLLAINNPAQLYSHSLLWAYLIVSAGAGIMFTNTFAAALGSVSVALSGITAGYINSIQQIGNLSGVAFASSHNVTTSYATIYGSLTALAVVALLASLFIQNKK